MIPHAAEYRRCLVDLDVAVVRRLSAHTDPHLPQPTDSEALACLHMARTASQTIVPRLRYYSHRWLLDRGLPSQLPDRLKRSADRMYPRKVTAVGIAVGSPLPQVSRSISGAMEYAVADCFANGDGDDHLTVRTRMIEARLRERRALGLPDKLELPPLWRAEHRKGLAWLNQG
jgi:hypothetical protein